MSKEDNLWNIAIAQSNKQQGNPEEATSSEEKSVLIVGSRNSGKTSIVLRFLDKDEVAKPTTALEYTYARKSKGHNLAKDVGHIWELGGGTMLSKLIEIPINHISILNTGLVIVLDLSAPNELWFTLDTLLEVAQKCIQTAIQEAQHTDPQIKDKLQAAAWLRVGGEDHMDKDLMDLFLIPLIILGSKYDLFQSLDSEKRKTICKTLRFVAHTYGATLQFLSIKQEATLNKSRSLISHIIFGTALGKAMQVDHNKPLIVPAGLDSFQQIGNPPLEEEKLGRGRARTPIELWKNAFTEIFPQESVKTPATVDDPAKDPQYAELAIDQLRLQKDQELERYRKLCERKMKEAQNKALQEGLVF